MTTRIRTMGQTMIYKIHRRKLRKTGYELRCPGKVSNSCSSRHIQTHTHIHILIRTANKTVAAPCTIYLTNSNEISGSTWKSPVTCIYYCLKRIVSIQLASCVLHPTWIWAHYSCNLTQNTKHDSHITL